MLVRTNPPVIVTSAPHDSIARYLPGHFNARNALLNARSAKNAQTLTEQYTIAAENCEQTLSDQQSMLFTEMGTHRRGIREAHDAELDQTMSSLGNQRTNAQYAHVERNNGAGDEPPDCRHGR